KHGDRKGRHYYMTAPSATSLVCIVVATLAVAMLECTKCFSSLWLAVDGREPFQSHHLCQAAIEIGQEFGIVGRFGHLLEQRLHGFQPSLLAQVREHATHRNDRAIGLLV